MTQATNVQKTEFIAGKTGIEANLIEALALPDAELSKYFNRVSDLEYKEKKASELAIVFCGVAVASFVSGLSGVVESNIQHSGLVLLSAVVAIFGTAASLGGAMGQALIVGKLPQEPANVARELRELMKKKMENDKIEADFVAFISAPAPGVK